MDGQPPKVFCHIQKYHTRLYLHIPLQGGVLGPKNLVILRITATLPYLEIFLQRARFLKVLLIAPTHISSTNCPSTLLSIATLSPSFPSFHWEILGDFDIRVHLNWYMKGPCISFANFWLHIAVSMAFVCMRLPANVFKWRSLKNIFLTSLSIYWNRNQLTGSFPNPDVNQTQILFDFPYWRWQIRWIGNKSTVGRWVTMIIEQRWLRSNLLLLVKDKWLSLTESST